MSLILHLQEVMHYLTSKGLGKFLELQGNLEFAVIILMLEKHCWSPTRHGTDGQHIPLPLLSLCLFPTKCRISYLESHDAARMPRERPPSFSGGDVPLLPLESCGVSAAVETSSKEGVGLRTSDLSLPATARLPATLGQDTAACSHCRDNWVATSAREGLVEALSVKHTLASSESLSLLPHPWGLGCPPKSRDTARLPSPLFEKWISWVI